MTDKRGRGVCLPEEFADDAQLLGRNVLLALHHSPAMKPQPIGGASNRAARRRGASRDPAWQSPGLGRRTRGPEVEELIKGTQFASKIKVQKWSLNRIPTVFRLTVDRLLAEEKT